MRKIKENTYTDFDMKLEREVVVTEYVVGGGLDKKALFSIMCFVLITLLLTFLLALWTFGFSSIKESSIIALLISFILFLIVFPASLEPREEFKTREGAERYVKYLEKK